MVPVASLPDDATTLKAVSLKFYDTFICILLTRDVKNQFS
jgi:hypothetical protein